MVTPVSDQTSRPKRNELFWVEQDSLSQSAASNKPRTRRLINSHVQRFSNNTQRLNKARDLDAKFVPALEAGQVSQRLQPAGEQQQFCVRGEWGQSVSSGISSAILPAPTQEPLRQLIDVAICPAATLGWFYRRGRRPFQCHYSTA